jgi:hypothetical protein
VAATATSVLTSPTTDITTNAEVLAGTPRWVV